MLARQWPRVRISLTVVLVAGYLPDICRIILGFGADLNTANILSHSLPAVAVQAVVVGAIGKFARCRTEDALLLIVMVMSHWPADLLTGCKPTWPGGPVLGWALYTRPGIDWVMEVLLVVIGLTIPSTRHSIIHAMPRVNRWAVLLSLVVIQTIVLGAMAATSVVRYHGRDWQWRPAGGLTHFQAMGVITPECRR